MHIHHNMLAPPGGLARAGTRSNVTTCDVYPQPFVVLVVMVLIFTMFFHIKCIFSEVDCISCFQMQLIIECFDHVQTSVFFAKSGGKIYNHLQFTAYPFDTICHACCLVTMYTSSVP